MLPSAVCCYLILNFIPLCLFAQTNPVVPNAAQSDVVQQDTSRTKIGEENAVNEQTATGRFWKVRTSRTDSGWVAEMQIPWQTLRYARSADSIPVQYDVQHRSVEESVVSV